MPKNDANYRSAVLRLARLRGVHTEFVDASGKRCRAPQDSLARVLETLGSPAATLSQARQSIDELAKRTTQRRFEPVTVAWQGRPAAVRVSLAGGRIKSVFQCTLTLESGEQRRWACDPSGLKTSRRSRSSPPTAALPLPADLPIGYHDLSVEIDGREWRTRVICAPERCYRNPQEQDWAWGIFAPVYSLRSQRSLGCGDLTDLRTLADWSASLGGRVIATLPILSAQLGTPYEPSPYSPVSRLFWNELFLDPAATPEFARCAESRQLMDSPAVREEARRLRTRPLVDYRGCSALKRRVLRPLARQFFAEGGGQEGSFQEFLRQNPLVERFATFVAVHEKQSAAWQDWPARLQSGDFAPSDFDVQVRDYHLYCQFAMARSLGEWSGAMKRRQGILYLDLPLGVNPAGFDTFHHRDIFMVGCSTGAPPDPYFTGGQDWGFAPIHPDEQRESGYEYLAASLRNHMRYADYLRLDHVMCFHRLFVIPRGASPSEGVYLSYHPEEAYAVLSLESHRAQCRLVGENLGTVPPEVNEALERHDLCGLYVGQYEMQPSPQRALRPVPQNCVASLNTHDMAPLATFWGEADIQDRVSLGMLREEERAEELARRQRIKEALIRLLTKQGLLDRAKGPEVAAIRDALLQFLARSPADFLLANLEDLWLETQWQNVPGTLDEHPNWQRRLRSTLEEVTASEDLSRMMNRINDWRCGKGTKPHAKVSTKPRRKKRAAAKLG